MHGLKVNVDGINIHYERVGTGEHHVLLLPGSLGIYLLYSFIIHFYCYETHVVFIKRNIAH